MTKPAFVWKRRVGFGDCDPARIAYTGSIASMALEAIDAFWEDLLEGNGWFQMNVDQGYGMPFVHMSYDFRSPVTARAPLYCDVFPTDIGTSSVALRVVGRQQDRLCFEAAFVSVFVETASLGKMEVPEAVRRALEGAMT